MLAQKEIEEFKSDGVLIVKGLIDIDELASLRERAEWFGALPCSTTIMFAGP